MGSSVVDYAVQHRWQQVNILWSTTGHIVKLGGITQRRPDGIKGTEEVKIT